MFERVFAVEAELPIDRLVAADSPRLNGVDLDHAQALADSGAELPPILVHRPTMRVVDGEHRLRAVILRGDSTIPVCYFDGEERDAFVLAVRANIAHGLPLSLADRVAAAVRVMETHPDWSDRAIAELTLLGHQTVGDLRRRSTGRPDQLNTRVGRDGRSRPLNSARARRLAGELMTRDPNASLRQIARVAGISPGTVRDVRLRLQRGEDPVPDRQRKADAEPAESAPAERPERRLGEVRRLVDRAREREIPDQLRMLRQDPSLRFSETGRTLLRLLDVYGPVSAQADALVLAVPKHCAYVVADVAEACAAAWQVLADRLRAERPGAVG